MLSAMKQAQRQGGALAFVRCQSMLRGAAYYLHSSAGGALATSEQWLLKQC
jgi:hypothetical protein